jgi:hypothetical protein
MGNHSNIARQAQMSGMNQNPAGAPAAPNVLLADPAGGAAAAQKVADYAFASGVLDDDAYEKTARPDWLGERVRALLTPEKSAAATTGAGNVGGGDARGATQQGQSARPRAGQGGYGPTLGQNTAQPQQGPLLGANATKPGLGITLGGVIWPA